MRVTWGVIIDSFVYVCILEIIYELYRFHGILSPAGLVSDAGMNYQVYEMYTPLLSSVYLGHRDNERNTQAKEMRHGAGPVLFVLQLPLKFMKKY